MIDGKGSRFHPPSPRLLRMKFSNPFPLKDPNIKFSTFLIFSTQKSPPLVADNSSKDCRVQLDNKQPIIPDLVSIFILLPCTLSLMPPVPPFYPAIASRDGGSLLRRRMRLLFSHFIHILFLIPTHSGARIGQLINHYSMVLVKGGQNDRYSGQC